MRFIMVACGVSLTGLLGVLAACSSPTIRGLDLGDGDGGHVTATDPNKPKPSGSSGTSGAPSTTCGKICAAAASANCSKQSSCVDDCEADQSKVPAGCKTEGDALQECAAKATSFKCSSDGKPTVASGCDTEGNAFIQCVLGGGKKDSGAPTTGCGNLSSGIPACDTCQNANCCTEAAACSNDAACGDVINCLSTNNCSTQACYTMCENAHPAGKAHEQAFYACLGAKCSAPCQ